MHHKALFTRNVKTDPLKLLPYFVWNGEFDEQNGFCTILLIKVTVIIDTMLYFDREFDQWGHSDVTCEYILVTDDSNF